MVSNKRNQMVAIWAVPLRQPQEAAGRQSDARLPGNRPAGSIASAARSAARAARAIKSSSSSTRPPSSSPRMVSATVPASAPCRPLPEHSGSQPFSCCCRATARSARAAAARHSGARRRRPASASAHAARASNSAACRFASWVRPWRHTPSSPSVARRNHAARRAAPAKIPAPVSRNAASQSSSACPVFATLGAGRSVQLARIAPEGSCKSSSHSAAYSARSASAERRRCRLALYRTGMISPAPPGTGGCQAHEPHIGLHARL